MCFLPRYSHAKISYSDPNTLSQPRYAPDSRVSKYVYALVEVASPYALVRIKSYALVWIPTSLWKCWGAYVGVPKVEEPSVRNKGL